MNKENIFVSIILSVILFGGLILPYTVSATVANDYNFQHDLKLGDENADVLALQKLLIQGGYLKITKSSQKFGYNPNGYFGEQTRLALAAWQKARGISPAAGLFGPVSRAKANAGLLLIPYRQLSVPDLSSTTTTTIKNIPIVKWIAKPCQNWVYTPWSACSSWGNQTRGILSVSPLNCTGGDFVLSQACNQISSTTSAIVTTTPAQSSVGTFRLGANRSMDDRLLAAAFLDYQQTVGLTCKPWVNKVASLVFGKPYILPLTNDDNYTWKLGVNNTVIAKTYSIENVSRGDIVQVNMYKRDLPHTAIVVSATPTGMVWIHSNWLTKKTVDVDFITYDYFKIAFANNYSIYHLQ